MNLHFQITDTYLVGSDEHAALIEEAIRQKILQNPKAAQALRESRGILTHRVPGRIKPIFKMERFVKQIYRELYGATPNER